MTKLVPKWVRTSDPVIRSPSRYRWTTAPSYLSLCTTIYMYLTLFRLNHPYFAVFALNCPHFTICVTFTPYMYYSVETAPLGEILEQLDHYAWIYYIYNYWAISKCHRRMPFVCWSLTSLCYSNGYIETMPAREINPFTALTRIRSQFLRTQ